MRASGTGQREHCLAIGSATPWTGVEVYDPLYKRPPAYPEDKRASQVEGSVLVEFTVDAEGYPKAPIVISSVGGGEFEAPGWTQSPDSDTHRGSWTVPRYPWRGCATGSCFPCATDFEKGGPRTGGNRR